MKLKEKYVLAFRCISTALIVSSLVTAGGAMPAIALGQAAAALAPSSPCNGKVYDVGNGVTAPVLVHSVDPKFPREGQEAGFRGASFVRAVIGTDGKVKEVSIYRSLGPEFDKNAMNAVRKYRFKPSLKDGVPVAVSIRVEIVFHGR